MNREPATKVVHAQGRGFKGRVGNDPNGLKIVEWVFTVCCLNRPKTAEFKTSESGFPPRELFRARGEEGRAFY